MPRRRVSTPSCGPAKGSKHNRGCAVDLSLYDIATGKPADMPSGYDEMTERASPDYKGGSDEQRQRRDLLRKAMESHGFHSRSGRVVAFRFIGIGPHTPSSIHHSRKLPVPRR